MLVIPVNPCQHLLFLSALVIPVNTCHFCQHLSFLSTLVIPVNTCHSSQPLSFLSALVIPVSSVISSVMSIFLRKSDQWFNAHIIYSIGTALKYSQFVYVKVIYLHKISNTSSIDHRQPELNCGIKLDSCIVS